MAENISVPKSVIEEDHRLEKSAEGSWADLLKLRWHWTLDGSNDKRVSMRAYARAVGKSHTVIERSVAAHKLRRGNPRLPPGDAWERARYSAETGAAIEAVAKARGVSLVTARQHHKDEVETVKAVARDRAERKQTAVADEINDVAKHLVSNAKRDGERATRGNQHDFAIALLQGWIARTRVGAAGTVHQFQEMLDDHFTDAEQEAIAESLATIRELLQAAEAYLRGKKTNLSEPLLKLVSEAK